MTAKKEPAAKAEAPKGDTESVRVALSSKPQFKHFTIWLVGDTPLITHAWSEKARREMLGKQTKATKGGKEARDPEADFVNSLYDMGDGYGFPAWVSRTVSCPRRIRTRASRGRR